MTVAIIIPTTSTAKWPATEAIEAVLRTTEDMDVQIVPVESSGPDFTFARSINAGFRNSPRANAWVLLNDDCFMDKGWLEEMLKVVEAHPDAGIISAALEYPDGETQYEGTWIPKNYVQAGLLWLRQHLPQRIKTPRHYYEKANVDTVIAACMLVTRRCFDVLGPFDERYPLSFEDTDYCLRAREAGFGIVFAENVTGVHIGGHSTGHLTGTKRKSYNIFRRAWPLKRIRKAIEGGYGKVHPSFCEHREEP